MTARPQGYYDTLLDVMTRDACGMRQCEACGGNGADDRDGGCLCVPCRKSPRCYGSDSGATSEMCGGCTGCLIMQRAYYRSLEID